MSFLELLLMEEIRLTSWKENIPVLYRVSKIKDGAGFLPSTVCSIARSIQFHKNSKVSVKTLEIIEIA